MLLVRNHDDCSKGTCQNPLLAFSELTPVNCANVSSTVGRRCISRCTFSFNGFRSMQMHIVPILFSTTTMPAHHGVDSSTFEKLPALISFCLILGAHWHLDIARCENSKRLSPSF